MEATLESPDRKRCCGTVKRRDSGLSPRVAARVISTDGDKPAKRFGEAKRVSRYLSGEASYNRTSGQEGPALRSRAQRRQNHPRHRISVCGA